MKILVSLFLLVLTPCIAFGAESNSINPHMWWRIIDFIIFAGFIYYFLKKPIVNYFKTRKETIHNNLAEAERMKKEAERLLKETESKLSQLDSEIERIVQTFKSMAKNERENILKEAQAAIKRIEENIEDEKLSLLSRAKFELLKRMTAEAISNVKKKLSSLKHDEHANINKKFIRSIT